MDYEWAPAQPCCACILSLLFYSTTTENRLLKPIVKNFDQAATTYERHSWIQRNIATDLATRVSDLPLPFGSILEIGCGTGNLTRLLAESYPDASILATDASPRMVAESSRYNESPNVTFDTLVLNTRTKLDADYDLIVASMTLQWTDNLKKVLKALLPHCRCLAFSIPIEGTFENWIEAHDSLGYSAGIRELPSEEQLQEMTSSSAHSIIDTKDFSYRFRKPIDFVRNLRQIGGYAPRSNHVPVNLRRVFSQFPKGIDICYRIAFAVLLNPTGGPR